MTFKKSLLVLCSLLTFAMGNSQVVSFPEGNQACVGDSLLLVAQHEFEDIQWNNSAILDSIWVNQSGLYFFTSIEGEMRSDSVEINFTPLPDPLTNPEHVTCFGLNDGSVEIFSVAGVPIQSVIWQDKLNGSSIFNLFAGEYNYVFTDINGCVAVGSVVIEEPQPIIITDLSVSNELLSIEAEGGTPPYSYFWNEEAVENPAPYAGEDLFIEVIDIEGCSAETVYSGIDSKLVENCLPFFNSNELILPCFRDGDRSEVVLYTLSGQEIKKSNFINGRVKLEHTIPPVVLLNYHEGHVNTWIRIAKVK